MAQALARETYRLWQDDLPNIHLGIGSLRRLHEATQSSPTHAIIFRPETRQLLTLLRRSHALQALLWPWPEQEPEEALDAFLAQAVTLGCFTRDTKTLLGYCWFSKIRPHADAEVSAYWRFTRRARAEHCLMPLLRWAACEWDVSCFFAHTMASTSSRLLHAVGFTPATQDCDAHRRWITTWQCSLPLKEVSHAAR